jgi:uncharacterized protein (DUF1330 family)
MAKGYIVARVSVSDPDAYMEYIRNASVAMKKYGATILAAGGRSEALEGEKRDRNVILEFESFDQAKAYFNSPEYQSARLHRAAPGVSVGEFVVIEGVDEAH